MYQYKRLLEEGLLEEHEHVPLQPTQSRRSFLLKRPVWVWIFQILFFLVSLAMFLFGLQSRHKASEKWSVVDFLPQWSPVLEAVKNTRYITRFDGSFATPNAFKGTPSPDIDKSWDSITYADGEGFSHQGSLMGGVSLTNRNRRCHQHRRQHSARC
jgi:hypothetical protein